MKTQPVNDTKPPRPGRTVEAAASTWLRALQDSEAPIPKGLCAANGSSVAQRFGVHRNNVLSACVQALVDTFPVCQAMVGQDFFHAMALAFARQHSPRNRRMAFYGEDFAGFIHHFAPAQSVPCLSDLACLEMARVQAYHAADVPDALADAAITSLHATLQQPAHLPGLRFQLHPCLSLIGFEWAVVSLWQAHQHEATERDALLSALRLDQAERVAVFRDGDAVRCAPLSLADLCLWRHVQAGLPLGEALARASTTAREWDAPEPDIHHCLRLLVQHRLITHVITPLET